MLINVAASTDSSRRDNTIVVNEAWVAINDTASNRTGARPEMGSVKP